MRIWDLAAGYLNRQSLLAEHRELHGLVSILVHGKTGYSRHPETLRWVGCLSGLAHRHELLAAEMKLRGYVDRTPVTGLERRSRWPTSYVTDPGDQLSLLRSKYIGKAGGRIPIPRSAQELWGSHKYSVMARDPSEYRTIGRRVAAIRRSPNLSPLAGDLVELLRIAPSQPRLANALEHMWGHVARSATEAERRKGVLSLELLLTSTQEIAARIGEPFLSTSTALSELEIYVPCRVSRVNGNWLLKTRDVAATD